MAKIDLDIVLADPSSVFEAPEDVVSAAGLSRRQKAEVLRRWEFAASEQAVATEEGMPGNDSDLLRRILLALGRLGVAADLEHTAPAKNHALAREAIATASGRAARKVTR